MAKRQPKAANSSDSKVRPLFPRSAGIDGGWDPLGSERREQSYVRKVKPQSPGQKVLMEAIAAHNLTLALGPAGTGKTYLAISAAVEALDANRVDRIVLSRPAIEAGESIGYLPGDMNEKMAPFLRPLYDALSDRLGGKRLRALMADGTIEIAPVGFMRGRTLNNAFVVIDEAQNCTYAQIKMLLTRLGWHSTMVLTGDPDQSDLLNGLSGLADIARRVETLDNIAVVRLADTDIVRHPLVASMLTVL
ncbi:PhoH family protein [Indioceanicola profundi]|uniref:PhoH family protein n=1 Tax=Indioceanicola profundi TaxID=2220096 RepID=UPI000E6ABBFA|nr:PhoH family protein [Indioceanicola profundi]